MQKIFSRKNFTILLLAIAILVILGLGLFLPLKPIGYPLYQWNLTYNEESTSVTLPESRMIQPGISEMTLVTTFPAVAGDTLVLPRISGNAVEVTLNGELIYRFGDFNAPTSNLWNSQLIVMLPKSLRAENKLEVRIASTAFGIGFSAVPYLAPYSQAAERVLFLNWISSDLLMMTSGAVLIVGVMLLLSCSLRHQWHNTQFFIGMGLICCAGYNQDVFFRATSGDLITFLWVTKAMLLSSYLAGMFLICGLEVYFNKHIKISRWAAGTVAACGLVLLLAPNLYWLTLINQYSSGIIFISMVLSSLFFLKAPGSSGWLQLIYILIAISVLQTVYMLLTNSSSPILLPYSISLSTLIIGVNSILESNQIFNENRLLRHTSNLDPLTGALNRRVLEKIDTNIYHFAVLIDLDGFKNLNDCHGHIMGDQILIEFTNVIRSNLRQDDLVIRWGGDEFLLVFANVLETAEGHQNVENIVRRISIQFQNVHPDMDLSFSYGIVKVQSPFEQCLQEADRLMYNMKQDHRQKARAAEESPEMM